MSDRLATQYPDPARLLQAARAQASARINSFVLDGQVFWAKRPENLPARMRLQKGDSQGSFGREVALLRAFAARGAPVPSVLAEEPDLIVLPDMGVPLSRLVKQAEPAVAMMLVRKAALGLVVLHRNGLAHGRPSLRDLCWNGAQVTFLDLEAGARLDAGEWRQARDVALLLHSITRLAVDKNAMVQAARAAYSAEGNPRILQKVRRLARFLGLPIAPFARFAPKPEGRLGEVAALVHLVTFLR